MGFQAEAYYAKDGSVLYNYTNKYYDLTPIIPDTIAEYTFYKTFEAYQRKYGKV